MDRLGISTWRFGLRSSIPLAALHTNCIITAQIPHQLTPRIRSANHTIGMDYPPSYRSYAETDPYFERESLQDDEESNPGIFGDLRGFLQLENASLEVPKYRDYRKVDRIKPEPGAIIHIIDNGSPPQATGSHLHQRVMLVVRHEQPVTMTTRAMTCLPLCSHAHGIPKDDKQHWIVRQKSDSPTTVGEPDQARQTRKGMPKICHALEVVLGRDLYLEEGITVNLGEPWHVEYDHILIDQIGQVSSSSGERALRRAGDLFKKSLDETCSQLAKSIEEKIPTSRDPWDGYWKRKHHR